MTTNKNFDKHHNISKETALRIQATFLTLPQNAIMKVFDEFCLKEKYMGEIANHVVEVYSKLIVNNTLLGEPIDDDDLDPISMDPVDDALNVAHAYRSIAIILRNIFLIGLHGGQAITDEQFITQFDINNVIDEKKEKTSLPTIKSKITGDNTNAQIIEAGNFLKDLFESLGIKLDIKKEELDKDDKEQV